MYKTNNKIMNTPSTTTETLQNLFANDINPTPKPLFSWNTTKVENGFKGIVTKGTPRITPNENGSYLDTEVLQEFVLPTRARAKSHAQKWVRYYKANA